MPELTSMEVHQLMNDLDVVREAADTINGVATQLHYLIQAVAEEDAEIVVEATFKIKLNKKVK